MKIYFRPGSQYENTGDVLINYCAVNLYSKFGHVKIIKYGLPDTYIQQISSGDREIFKRRFFLTAIAFDSLTHVFKKGKYKSSIFYALPPGHLQRDGLRPILGSIKTILHVLFLRLFAVRTIRLGVSIAGGGAVSRRIESILSKLMHCYGVRDKESLVYAKRNKFSNVILFPDFSWSYKTNNYRKVDFLDRHGVVFSFRSNKFGKKYYQNYLDDHLSFIKSKIISEIINCGDNVISSYQVEFDKLSATKMKEYFAGALEIDLIDKKLELLDAESLYGMARMVFSNRLHVLILAGLSGAVPVGIVKKSDNKKIISLFGDVGLSESLIIIDDENAKEHRNIFSEEHCLEVISRFQKISEMQEIETYNIAQKIFAR